MQIYTVHEPLRPPQPLERWTLDERAQALVFVKEGFSLPAFLFGPFWLLAHRLWLPLALYIAAAVVLLAVLSSMPGGASVLGSLLFLAALAFGLEANGLLRWGLERRASPMIGAVAGKTFEECEQRFLTGWLAEQRQAQGDARGLEAAGPHAGPRATAATSGAGTTGTGTRVPGSDAGAGLPRSASATSGLPHSVYR